MGFALLLLSSTEGWSLPPCPEDTNTVWDNCFGTYTWTDGTKYVGGYKDDKKHGQGTLTLANGNKYVGEFKNGLPNGLGIHTSADGDKYVGEFKDGKKYGHGTHTFVNGDNIDNYQLHPHLYAIRSFCN